MVAAAVPWEGACANLSTKGDHWHADTLAQALDDRGKAHQSMENFRWLYKRGKSTRQSSCIAAQTGSEVLVRVLTLQRREAVP